MVQLQPLTLTSNDTVCDGERANSRPPGPTEAATKSADAAVCSGEPQQISTFGNGGLGTEPHSANRHYKHLSSFITSIHRRITIDSWVAQLEHNVPHVWGQQVRASLHVCCCCCTTDSKQRADFTHEAECQGVIDDYSLHGVL